MLLYNHNLQHNHVDHFNAVRDALDTIQATNSTTPHYKVLHTPDIERIIKDNKQFVDHIRKRFSNCIFVGAGAAHSIPQMLCSLQRHDKELKFSFLDSTDPIYISKFIQGIEFYKTAIIMVSKSGFTAETKALMHMFIHQIRLQRVKVEKRLFICTGKETNPLRIFGERHGLPIVDYEDDIAGRFACFSNPGILAASLAGLDMHQLARGASYIAGEIAQLGVLSPQANGASSMVFSGMPIAATIAYSKALEPFLIWYRQLIAESLGKNGKGITPLVGVGPAEQHSMLQLYLDGPKDKIFTTITIERPWGDIEMDGYADTRIETTNRRQFSITEEALAKKNMPRRHISLDKFDEYNMGLLMNYAVHETILAGLLMGIDPFTQPSVDVLRYRGSALKE